MIVRYRQHMAGLDVEIGIPAKADPFNQARQSLLKVPLIAFDSGNIRQFIKPVLRLFLCFSVIAPPISGSSLSTLTMVASRLAQATRIDNLTKRPRIGYCGTV